MKENKSAIIRFLLCFLLALIGYLPTIRWMVDRWMAHESYYSHGFLIPLVSLFIIWQRKAEIMKAVIKGEGLGLWIAAVGIVTHMISIVLRVYFVSGFSLVFVLYGLVLFCFGRQVTRQLIFPIFFLLAMIPLPLVIIGNLTVQMKLLAGQVAAFLLNRIGFPSMLDGSILRMPQSFTVIGAPCSGLRSLISLITLGLLFAYALKISLIKKAVLLLSSVPIAIGTNVIRIMLLAIVNDLYGEKVAMGFFHDFSGFLVFAMAFMALLWVSELLKGRQEAGYA